MSPRKVFALALTDELEARGCNVHEDLEVCRCGIPEVNRMQSSRTSKVTELAVDG